MPRQAIPMLMPTSADESPEPLRRLALQETGQYDERWLQELVHRSPSVLPINSIEPAFWPAIPVCMELPLRSGYLDNFLVTPLGNLVAVECKLWRNPEAIRKVLAQIIDYAKDLQAIGYAELEDAIRKARKEPSYVLFAAAPEAADGGTALDEAEFIDAVSRNLRRGRFLLLIVGDGVTENLEEMAAFLQQHAGLHFGLALVQLAVHELPGTSRRIVVPSIPMQTSTIVRGIVEWVEPGVRISPPPQTATQTTPKTLTEEEFFAGLDDGRPGTSDRLVGFLRDCEDLQVTWEVRKTLIVRMIVDEYGRSW